MKLGAPDSSGRRRPEPSEAPTQVLPCEVVIRAIGQRFDERLSVGSGAIVLREGCIAVNPETGQTSLPRYFAGGDCVNGGREVVHAAAEGRRAAHGIHRSLVNQEVSGG